MTKLSNSEVERRRAAAERMCGLFADVSPDRSLVDELIADRQAEAAAESENRQLPAPRRLRSLVMTDETLIAEAGRRLAAAAPDATVILFGSRARGEGRPDSDLDLSSSSLI